MYEQQCEPYFLCDQKTLMLQYKGHNHSFSKQSSNISGMLNTFASSAWERKQSSTYLIKKEINDMKIKLQGQSF
jgi:hypothetical protein